MDSIDKIHTYVVNEKASNSQESHGDIFDVQIKDDQLDIDDLAKAKIIPVVYQPSIDSLRNFVREIHCFELEPGVMEVSILFENEELRRHRLVNHIYELFRLFVYGREIDVETFKIKMNKEEEDDISINKKLFQFENIYSSDYGIEEDSIHENPRPPDVRVKYYFSNYRYPIIFINISNHAMAEHDNNHDLWKWEYIPFLKNAPVRFGTKSRRHIDSEFKPFYKKWTRQ